MKIFNAIKYLSLILIFLFSCKTTDPALSHTLGKQKPKKDKVVRVKRGVDKNCPGFTKCK